MYLILCVVTSSYLLQVLNSFLSAGLAQTDACSVFAGKFGGIFASVPQPMVAAIFCILFAYFGMHQELIVMLYAQEASLPPNFHFEVSSMTNPDERLYVAIMAGSTGISCLQFLNMNSQRNIFVIGFSLFMALSVPQYFREYTISAGRGPAHTQAHWVCYCPPF